MALNQFPPGRKSVAPGTKQNREITFFILTENWNLEALKCSIACRII
jgi:hypothetical protein